MGAETGIAWTDHTYNPWWGCVRVSPGCTNCYAETWDRRWAKTDVAVRAGGSIVEDVVVTHWGVQAPRRFFGDSHWNEPRKWNRAAQAAGKRARVFCSSMADVFEDRRDLDAQRERLWRLIEETPHLDWQLLTKRPENMLRLAPPAWAARWPANVWAGTTVEDQKRADERIPELLRVPAAVRFLSCEPLLEAVDLDPPRCDDHGRDHIKVGADGEFCNECAAGGWSGELSYGHWLRLEDGIDWVIVGGESGGDARPMRLEWARSIVEQCRAAGVACFVKQAGAHVTWDGCSSHGWRWPRGTITEDTGLGHWLVKLRDRNGGDISEWPDNLRVREFPAQHHAAGGK